MRVALTVLACVGWFIGIPAAFMQLVRWKRRGE